MTHGMNKFTRMGAAPRCGLLARTCSTTGNGDGRAGGDKKTAHVWKCKQKLRLN